MINVEKFWSKVNVSDEDSCWNWMASKDPKGRARVAVNGINEVAARVIYFHHNPFANRNLFVCHTCDNPACVNPSHLFLGTSTDNSEDMVNKGRNFVPGLKGEQSPVSKLTVEDVLAIRADTTSKATSLARKYGVRDMQIYRIRTRKAWAHI